MVLSEGIGWSNIMNDLKYDIRIASASRELVAIEDFRLAESSITVLFGESGIGKSLSALAVAGLLDPDQLEVRLNGLKYSDYLRSAELSNIRRNGFFVFQEPSSHLNPLMTLRTQLREGALAKTSGEERILERLWQGAPTSQVQSILDVYPKPYRPSGGEKQRILAAMAFKKMSAIAAATPGAVFIFDEPTGNLDNKLRDEFLDLLVENFRARHGTVLLITHDYSMISRFTSLYADLAKRIHYEELLLVRGKLQLKEFLPSAYLNWIGDRKARARSARDNEVFVKLEPRLQVFGRTLLVTRDRAGKNSEPLLIRKGSMVYLKAPSGVGKTTVVKLMMGLLSPERMSMHLRGVEYTERTHRKIWSDHVWGRQMAMVFQHADEALNQNAFVRDVFAGLPLKAPMDDETILRTLSELFEDEPDHEFLRKPVKHLSGGQKQRLNLLRSMVLDTDILILDEPLNGLDFESSVKVLAKIEDRLQRGKSVLVISHNEEIFDSLAAPEDVYYLHAPS
jgi:peptide/nickel transport system ATP-binding protein